MPRTAVRKPASLEHAANAWLNALERARALSAARDASPDPEAQHHELAVERAIGSMLRARAALIELVPDLPCAIAVDSGLVVVAPAEHDAIECRSRWSRDDIQVTTVPRGSIRWGS